MYIKKAVGFTCLYVLFCRSYSLHYDPRLPGISEELTLATLEEFIADAEQAV
jgi:hypothetical protein